MTAFNLHSWMERPWAALRAIRIIALLALLAPPMPVLATPSIFNLGTLGGSSSSGASINASGQIAGTSQTLLLEDHAFLYTGTPGSGGQMLDLGKLSGPYSYGYAINASGQVAGYSYVSSTSKHAFVYSGTPGSGGYMYDLGTLATYMLSAASSIAWAINPTTLNGHFTPDFRQSKPPERGIFDATSVVGLTVPAKLLARPPMPISPSTPSDPWWIWARWAATPATAMRSTMPDKLPGPAI